MKEGIFITIEGIDGVGKSTQARQLAQRLDAAGRSVLHTWEPGGTAVGQRIRNLLLDASLPEMVPQTEILLYAADRAQHGAEVIVPALGRGQVVVCERFVDSSLAYQGYGLGWDCKAIAEINYWALGGLMPDLTLCLDHEPQKALGRAGQDRIEQRDLDYYHRVRAGFLELAAAEPQRWAIVPAGGSAAHVAVLVWEEVRRRVLL